MSKYEKDHRGVSLLRLSISDTQEIPKYVSCRGENDENNVKCTAKDHLDRQQRDYCHFDRNHSSKTKITTRKSNLFKVGLSYFCHTSKITAIYEVGPCSLRKSLM